MMSQDGQAHVAYFDFRSQASFVWDGMSEVIDVCIGGYGEPVDHTISADVVVRNGRIYPLEGEVRHNPSMANLNWFAAVCQAHAKTLPTY